MSMHPTTHHHINVFYFLHLEWCNASSSSFFFLASVFSYRSFHCWFFIIIIIFLSNKERSEKKTTKFTHINGFAFIVFSPADLYLNSFSLKRRGKKNMEFILFQLLKRTNLITSFALLWPFSTLRNCFWVELQFSGLCLVQSIKGTLSHSLVVLLSINCKHCCDWRHTDMDSIKKRRSDRVSNNE